MGCTPRAGWSTRGSARVLRFSAVELAEHEVLDHTMEQKRSCDDGTGTCGALAPIRGASEEGEHVSEHDDDYPYPPDIVAEHMHILAHGQPVEDRPIWLRSPLDRVSAQEQAARLNRRRGLRGAQRPRARRLAPHRAPRQPRTRRTTRPAVPSSPSADPPGPPSGSSTRDTLGGTHAS